MFRKPYMIDQAAGTFFQQTQQAARSAVRCIEQPTKFHQMSTSQEPVEDTFARYVRVVTVDPSMGDVI